MAVAGDVGRRWRSWMLRSWLAILGVVLAGMWWSVIVDEAGPPYTLDSVLENAVTATLAVLAYGVFVAGALTIALLPTALGTFLWEHRWGRARPGLDGDAIGGLIAAACTIPIVLLPAVVRPGIVIIAFPLFMAARGLARARVDALADATACGRMILLLMMAEAVTVAIQLLLPGSAAAILVFVPIGAVAVALGLRSTSWRTDGLLATLALQRPSSWRAWLVALLPAVTLVFALLMNVGITYSDTTLAMILTLVTAEIVFRGFAFVRLRRAGARFLVAAVVPATMALIPVLIFMRSELAFVVVAGMLAQSIWLAWLVERWQSTWIAIVSVVLLAIGLDNFAMFAETTRVWFTLALRLWIIGISVALTQTMQRRDPMSSMRA